MNRQALGHVRVLDTSIGRAGPLAAMLLADFGAEVVAVGSPNTFPVWNRGKCFVSVDRNRLDSLIRGADVVVASDPEVTDRAHALDPGLIVLHVPPCLG